LLTIHFSHVLSSERTTAPFSHRLPNTGRNLLPLETVAERGSQSFIVTEVANYGCQW
jgi:hypothetical protein